MDSKNYVYYQPNDKDRGDDYGDCVVRSLSKVLNKTWMETFKMLVDICMEKQCLPDEKAAYEELLESKGFTYQGISNRRGSKRPLVSVFAKKEHRPCILVVAHHIVASQDGNFYDTWDCGHKSMYGYWIKKE